MDSKSIVFSKRMKFFFNITRESSCPSQNWDGLCGVQDIPEPFHPLFCPCSMHRNQRPTNGGPSIVCPRTETPSEEAVRNAPSISSQECSPSKREDTQHAYGHGPCPQTPLRFERSQHCKSEQADHDNAPDDPLSKSCNDIWATILYDILYYLSNGSSYGSPTFHKSKIFIETKSN